MDQRLVKDTENVLGADGVPIVHTVFKNGNEEWRRKDNNQLHRTDGPARFISEQQREEWFINGQFHRGDGPAVISQNHYFHWIWHGKSYKFDAWVRKAGITADQREHFRSKYNEEKLNKHEIKFFSYGILESRFPYIYNRRKKIQYEDLLKVLSHTPRSDGVEADKTVEEINSNAKNHGLGGNIIAHDLTRKIVDGFSWSSIEGPYIIEIRGLEIYFRGTNPEEDDILSIKPDENRNGYFGVKFIDNVFIGYNARNNVGNNDAKNTHFRLKAKYIEMRRNTVLESGLTLFGNTIKLAGNKVSGTTHIHSYIRSGEKNISANVLLMNNSFAAISVDSKGTLEMGGKNRVGMFLHVTGKFNAENWYIGPKLKLDYSESNLVWHKNMFIDLLGKAIDSNDKAQQKIIEREIARLDFHIYRKMNRDNLWEWPDLFIRLVVYIFKLQFYDRYLWVKSFLLVLAFLLLLLPPISAMVSLYSHYASTSPAESSSNSP